MTLEPVLPELEETADPELVDFQRRLWWTLPLTAGVTALSIATVTNMRQNLAFAIVYNALGVLLAAGVLCPFTGWLLSPMIAALAMSLSSAPVIGNALHLRAAGLRKG